MAPLSFGSIYCIPRNKTLQAKTDIAKEREEELSRQRIPNQAVAIPKKMIKIVDDLCDGKDWLDINQVETKARERYNDDETPWDADAEVFVLTDDEEGKHLSALKPLLADDDGIGAYIIIKTILLSNQMDEQAEKAATATNYSYRC